MNDVSTSGRGSQARFVMYIIAQIRIILDIAKLDESELPDEVIKQIEKWQALHLRMVEAYEPIKRNSELKPLFRPGRESRWGPAKI